MFSRVGSEIPMPCLNESSIWRPADLPKTTKSNNEFPPKRFPPCTETQAASPAAYRPSTILSEPSDCWVMTWPWTFVGMPPIA